jgi:hypothetical protein
MWYSVVSGQVSPNQLSRIEVALPSDCFDDAPGGVNYLHSNSGQWSVNSDPIGRLRFVVPTSQSRDVGHPPVGCNVDLPVHASLFWSSTIPSDIEKFQAKSSFSPGADEDVRATADREVGATLIRLGADSDGWPRSGFSELGNFGRRSWRERKAAD